MGSRSVTCRICARALGPGLVSGQRGVCIHCARTRRGTASTGGERLRHPGIHPDGPAVEDAMEALRLPGPERELPGPGVLVGSLVVERKLGAGGMGAVLVARDPGLGRSVALKFLHPHLIGNERAEKFFLREARALAMLHHQNVVQVHSTGRWEGWPYLEMELVEGSPLSDRIRDGPMPVPAVLRIAVEMAEALAAVHAANLVHRDVNPANIMLRSRDGAACLVDFGLARGLTSTTKGVPVGTFRYAAPEQITGAAVDQRVDVYSLGVTLYEALAGGVPHEDRQGADYMRAVLEEDAPLLRTRRADAPPAMEALLARALSRAPEFRQPHGAALLEQVREVRRLAAGGAPAAADRVSEGSPGTASIPSKDPSESLPLVGRNEEYDAVLGALDGILMRRGRVILVEGEPGSGKTRMIREMTRAAHARGLGTIHCPGAEFSGSPYRALREGILQHARSLGAPTHDAVVALVERAAPSNGPLAPALRWFLAPGPGEVPGRTDLVRAVLALVRTFLGERPVLLVAEDAHLLDEGSLDLLVAAAEEGASWPLGLAFSFRTAGTLPPRAPLVSRLPRLLGVPGAVRVVLAPLSESAVATMVHLALGVDEAEACHVAPTLHRKCSGNPLFLLELLKNLDREKAPGVRDGGRRLRERLTGLAIPPRFLELASGRIADLDDAERVALEIASVDAQGVPADLVAQCLGLTRMRTLQTLQHLVMTRGVLQQHGNLYRIVHGEVREEVYAKLMPELRSTYHAEAAKSLEMSGAALSDPSRLGRHLARSGAAEQAVPHLLEAGRRLLAGHAPADALDHFEEALRCAGDAGCPAAGSGRAQALELLGDLDAARAALEGMVRAGGSEAAEALLPLAEFERNRGNHRAVLELLGRAAPLDLPADRRLRLLLLEAQAESRLANGEAALAALDRADALSAGASRMRLLELWNTQGLVRYRLGRYEEALGWFERALPLAEEVGSMERTSKLLHNLGLVCSDLRRSEEALAWAEKAAERALLIGNRMTLVYARLLRAELLLDSLGLQDAARELDGIEAEVHRLQDLDSLFWYTGCRAEVAFHGGDFTGCLDWVAKGLALRAERPQKVAELLLIRARVDLELSKPGDALAGARQARTLLDAGAEARRADEALAYAARALRELGRDGEEREALRSLADTLSPQAAVERALEERTAEGRETWLRRARDLAVEERAKLYLRRAGTVPGSA